MKHRAATLAVALFALTSASAEAATGPSPAQQQQAINAWNAGYDTTDASPPTTIPAPAAPSANAAVSCWGAIRNFWYHNLPGGAHVADIGETNAGWCGNGSTITRNDGFVAHHWAQYPYCLTNIETHSGWDGGGYRWAHGGIWTTAGVYSIAFVCIPVLGSEHRTLRIAANGYWDRWDDFGF